MTIFDTPKPCPHCDLAVNKADALLDEGTYACPSCNKPLVFVHWDGDHYIKSDYLWRIPEGFNPHYYEEYLSYGDLEALDWQP